MNRIISCILLASITLMESFLDVWNCPRWEHIDVFDRYIKYEVPEEKAEIFTDEFIYKILSTCEESQIDPWFVISTMVHESAFDPNAIAYDGKHFGLMQLSEKYHMWKIEALGGTDIFDPEDNIVVGIQYMGEIREQCETFKCLKESDLEYPLETMISMSYNKGLGIAVPLFKEGEIPKYTSDVINYYKRIKGKYGEINVEEILSDYEVPINANEYLKECIQ